MSGADPALPAAPGSPGSPGSSSSPGSPGAAASPVVADPWAALRAFTPARIALGRTGASQPTAAQLAFSLAHARARDAVHAALDVDALGAMLAREGFGSLRVRSRAPDRAAYLKRPDLGRRLDEASAHALRAAAPREPPALAIVVADGLSATAAMRHAVPLLVALRARLGAGAVGPVAIASQARVALADEAGECLGASAVAILLGERPGLSSPDSLGAYLTWAPRVGRSDAERECVSNIRPEGLSYERASDTLASLLGRARRLGASGVAAGTASPLPPAADGPGGDDPDA